MVLSRLSVLTVLLAPAYARKTLAEIRKGKEEICVSHPSQWSTCTAWDHSSYNRDVDPLWRQKSKDEGEKENDDVDDGSQPWQAVSDRMTLNADGVWECTWGQGSVNKKYLDTEDAMCVEKNCSEEPPENTCRCLSKDEAWNTVLSLKGAMFAIGMFLFALAQVLIQYGVWGQGTTRFRECVPLEGEDLQKELAKSTIEGDNFVFIGNAITHLLKAFVNAFMEILMVPYFWVADMTTYMGEGRVDSKGNPIPIIKAYGIFKKVGVILNIAALIIMALYADSAIGSESFVCTCGNLGLQCQGNW